MVVRWKVFFFPHHRISQISNQDVLEALVGAFCKWGCPKRLRVDNGEPLASPLPSTTSAFALCMIAYGITVHTNRPGVPQENGKVERQITGGSFQPTRDVGRGKEFPLDASAAGTNVRGHVGR